MSDGDAFSDPRTDPAHHELAWRGYSTRAMLPSFLLCAAATLLLMIGNRLLDDINLFHQRIGPIRVTGIVLVLWMVQLMRWLYRVVTATYRLTDRSVFVDRGFLTMPIAPFPLSDLIRVTSGGNLLQRLLRVGWVRLVDRSGREVRLSGLWRPELFAEQIEEARQRAIARTDPALPKQPAQR